MKNPLLFLIPVIAVVSLIMIRLYLGKKMHWKAWFASGIAIAGITLTGIAGLYPNLLPSSLEKAYSLTVHNSASSPLTLKIMLGVTLVFVPIVIVYQTWVYNLFKEKVMLKEPGYEEAY